MAAKEPEPRISEASLPYFEETYLPLLVKKENSVIILRQKEVEVKQPVTHGQLDINVG